MIKKTPIVFLLVTGLLIVLSACSGDDNQNASGNEDGNEQNEEEEKEKVEIPETPTEPEEIVENGPGQSFSSNLTDEDISNA